MTYNYGVVQVEEFRRLVVVLLNEWMNVSTSGPLQNEMQVVLEI